MEVREYEICLRDAYPVRGKSGKVRGSLILRGQVKLFECCPLSHEERLMVLNIELR